MPVYEGATIDEAIKHGLDVLGLTKDEVEINILGEGKKGFLGIGKKNAQVSIEPTVSEEISEAVEEVVTETVVREKIAEVDLSDTLTELDNEEALKQLAVYLTEVTKEMGVPALVKVDRGDNGLMILNLETDKQGMLIGKHGKILNALQYLAQVFVHRVAKNKLSVVVNVGNYRQKREEVLVRLAKRTAEKVKETGRPVFLEPMPAFERKMIHSALSYDEYIKTHSEGEEPYRYLVVEPAKKYF
ncbi:MULTISPECIES: RNA-binding cell elongation regulator Jag/EloR [Enterococcus]|uniref:RNA-binding protein KhpB n=1 Tax=Candidatus Enterococcus ferrettii TaxID=2815324 RepID=A0ABV0ENU8_9ENTE|nr:RNA-binding cell elongation regulator Jag/EloR [Enterococcus sp. 665A]MBO1340010.1 protein jag [Enterococcus sp. 665A]